MKLLLIPAILLVLAGSAIAWTPSWCLQHKNICSSTTTVSTTTIPQASGHPIGSSGGIPDYYGAYMTAKQFGGDLVIRYYNPFTKTIWIFDSVGDIHDTHMPLV